jgi:hypothetical protein
MKYKKFLILLYKSRIECLLMNYLVDNINFFRSIKFNKRKYWHNEIKTVYFLIDLVDIFASLYMSKCINLIMKVFKRIFT